MKIVSGANVLDLATRTSVVAILNVTPDSYYDGGKNVDRSSLLRSAQAAVSAGADILEIGGESTGPDSVDVPLSIELERVISAVKTIRLSFSDARIAVDTVKAAVAQAALRCGADMINDVSAGRSDPAMFAVIAKAGCRYIMMYSKDETPRTTRDDTHYADVVATIRSFLLERISEAKKAGIQASQIIIDPGLGHFVSSDPKYSFEILQRLREFSDLGPILVSPSRKSFLAGPNNLPPSERLPATLAATLTAVQNDARFIRTHDPKETVLMLRR